MSEPSLPRVDAGEDAANDASVGAAEDATEEGRSDAPREASPIPFEAGRCGQAACLGCCQGDVCLPGIDPTACGAGGQACQSCGDGGMVCAAQTCSLPCNAATCAGCCAGDQCLPGNSTAACGEGGVACISCAVLAAVCVSDGDAGGTCQAGASCGPGTCPDGCCDANGVCQPGSLGTACGAGGASCQACGAEGLCVDQGCLTLCNATTCPTGCCMAGAHGLLGAVCEPGTQNKQCGTSGRTCINCLPNGLQCYQQKCTIAPSCSCPDGCCDSNNQCQPGTSDALCGTGDDLCQTCTLSGKHCVDQGCSLQAADAGCGAVPCSLVCDKATCPSGCCDDFGVCQPGITNLDCGTAGASCNSCLDENATCASQACVRPDGASLCGSFNCQACCDPAGNCVNGSVDTQCGAGGTACLDCTAAVPGGTCNSGTSLCEAPDGGALCAETCEGCCDARGNCQGGFVDTECGAGGGRCQNCTALTPASTCDANVLPRVCTSQQTQCPAAYPACPAGLQESVPSPSPVCSAAEVESGATACAPGLDSTSCFDFFNFEYETNPLCRICLSVFAVDFATQAGIRACAAPFVDPTCNNNSACIVDCIAESCAQCVVDSTACETQAPSGSCAAFAKTDQCLTAALDGPAALCNPATYQGDFASWLQAVGAKYCGP